MAPVIIAKDLYKCYPGFPPVLRGVNISVEPGEMVAIMGPSGCGKSTMLHVLGMLHAPDAGTLEVLGTDVLTLGREQTAAFRRGNMGFVMQSSNLFDHSTVFENVEFPLIYENVPPEERWERVIRALELVRLSARVNYRSNRLSGGEQQRVAIARAMVNSPRILLADEPTGALDARTSKVVMENFRTLAHEGRVAMVVVTHDPSVAEYCDSVYTLDEGVLNCRRQDPVPAASGVGLSLLGAAPRRMNTACVVGRFPQPYATTTVQDALNLHAQGVLARVYSLYGAGLSALSGGDTHGLPVPVRRQSAWGLPGGLWALLGGLQKHSAVFWRMWSSVPLARRLWELPGRLRAFAVGVRMVGWCLTDAIEHVHALDARAPATAAWVASRLLGLPFSFSVHAGQVGSGGMPVSQLAAMAADAAFVRCDTEATRDALRAQCHAVNGVAEEKFVVLRDGLTLPAPEAEEAIPSMPPAEGAHVVQLLAAGCLARRKGLRVLLRACVLLKKQGVPFHLTIAGSGPSAWALPRLRWRVRLMGLRKQVSVRGQVPHENMGDLLHKSDIFVSPAVDGYGYGGQWSAALGEAMLYGLPVVATDLPGCREILEHERNGLVVEQKSPSALADALLRLMRFPDLAARLGSEAQKDVRQRFEMESGAHALADLMLAHRKTLPSPGAC